MAALRRVLSALDEQRTATAQPERMRNLAYLALARIFYSSAIRLNPETNIPTIDADHLNVAFRHWRKVAPESEYWLEAQHEMAWAYFMAGDYARALGAVHTIESPFFEDAEFLEMSALRSAICFVNCKYEAAMIVNARFQTRIGPMRTEIEHLLKLYERRTPEDFYALLLDLRLHRSGLTPETQTVASRVFRDRSLVRRFEHVALLDRERQSFSRLAQPLQTSTLGEELKAALLQSRKRAVAMLVDLAKGHYRHFVDEVHEQQRNGERILIDISVAQRVLLDKLIPMGPLSKVFPSHDPFSSSPFGARTDELTPPKDRRGSPRELLNRATVPPRWYDVRPPTSREGVVTDGDHVLWPFDGEYWRDELGTYQQGILSNCGGRGWGSRRSLL